VRLWQKAYLPAAGDDLYRSGRAALSASVRRRSGGRCRCPRWRLSAIKAAAAVWDQFGNVVVELGQCLVECGEPGPMCSRELCQVGVGYLAVADDSLGRHVGVRISSAQNSCRGLAAVSLRVVRAAAADWPSRMSSRIRLPWVIGQVAKPPVMPTNQFSAA
jgi:hypothetical protein